MRTLAALAVSVALIMPAAAQTTYYIVQDTQTKRCTVTHEKPTTTTTTTIVSPDGKVYTTESEATTAMKTVKVCDTK
jgi:hypothetical protein